MKKLFLLCAIVIVNHHIATAFQVPTSSKDAAKLSQLNVAATAYLCKNQLNEAEKTAHEAVIESLKQGSPSNHADALDNLGLVAQARFDYKNAMSFFVEAFKIREANGNKRGVAISKNRVGKVFHLQNNDAQALTNYQAALDMLTGNREDLPIIAETHRNMGDVQLSKKIFGKAIQEYELALKIWSQDLENIEESAILAAYLGKVTADIGDFDGAINNYNASLNFHRTLGNPTGVAYDFLNLSKIYNELKDNQLAIENAEGALTTFSEMDNKLGMAEANCQLAKVNLENNDKAQASLFFEKSRAILRGLPFQPAMPDIFKNIALGYASTGDFLKAYESYSDYAAAKDSLFSNEKARALVEMTTRFESELSVKDKNRQLANLEKEKATEQKLRWLLMGLVGFAGIALYSTYKNYRLKQRDNEKLKTLNLQIQAQHDQISIQNEALEDKNVELSDKNNRLDTLNARLVEEVAERERSQTSLFSKDHYLANTASRMRDPLSIIVGLSQNLMAEKPRTDQKEHIKELQFAANNLLVLINDALDFSKIEAGKLSFDNVDFTLADIVDEHRYESKSESKNTSKLVNFELAADLPKQLNGDPTRLMQIVTYLLKNMRLSIAYDTQLNVKIDTKERDNNNLIVSMRFNSDARFANTERWNMLLGNAETPHQIADATPTDIELTLTRRLVELQNGSIETEVLANGSLEIIVLLPFKMVENAGKAANSEGVVVVPMGEFLTGQHILIVEDNKINQMLVANMLRKRGAQITTANDGIDGIEAIYQGDFDLILMDIQMPRMDGYRAVAEIRRMKSKKANLPIVALTASTFINEKEKAQLFGMTDHIGKPFSPDELLQKIANVLAVYTPANYTNLVEAV
ncbi:MAG: response regulator [Saprospiraceae bacterium]|nr:response regulator [Saprospiraceae bacterium]